MVIVDVIFMLEADMSIPLFIAPRPLVSLLVVISLMSAPALARQNDLDEKQIVEALTEYFGSTFETSFTVDDDDGEKRNLILEIKKGVVTTFSINGEDRPLSDMEPYLDEFQNLSENLETLRHEKLVMAEEAHQLKAELRKMKEMQQSMAAMQQPSFVLKLAEKYLANVREISNEGRTLVWKRVSVNKAELSCPDIGASVWLR